MLDRTRNWMDREVLSPTVTSRLLSLPRYQKTIAVVLVDAVIAAAAAWGAIYLRLGQSHWLYGNQLIVVLLPIVIAPPVFYQSGLYRTIFRHGGAADMTSIARASLGFGLIYAGIVTMIGVAGVPRTVGLIQPVLMFVTLIAVRATALFLLRPRTPDGQEVENALIYGAGETGRQLAAALKRDQHIRAIGFLDDDRSLHNRTAHGIKVYPPDQAGRLVDELGIAKIFIAVPTASRYRRRQIIQSLGDVGVELRILPGLADVAKGQFSISDIRQVQIEDLLGREPVQPVTDLLNRDVIDQVVMVTGAGGSIGSELTRQILRIGPKRVILVDASEFAIYSIERELLELRDTDGSDIEIVALLASVQNEAHMRHIFETYAPQTVYHAAAYKHVPLIETNPLSGIENNGLGTFTTASLAREFGVRSFVLVSTDKAVRPTNIMGATKRFAELTVQALAQDGGPTRFSCVRFGNVLGSSGSVVPLFREQIQRGGPITITHPDVTRYFMTIPEAAQLVIQSGAMSSGGDIFLLDMGEPVRIAELAASMVRLSGLTVRNDRNPEGDIEICTVGLRPGEKLHEELLIEGNPERTEHPRIMRANEPSLTFHQILPEIEEIRRSVATNDIRSARAILCRLVPGYQPASTQ